MLNICSFILFHGSSVAGRYSSVIHMCEVQHDKSVFFSHRLLPLSTTFAHPLLHLNTESLCRTLCDCKAVVVPLVLSLSCLTVFINKSCVSVIFFLPHRLGSNVYIHVCSCFRLVSSPVSYWSLEQSETRETSEVDPGRKYGGMNYVSGTFLKEYIRIFFWTYLNSHCSGVVLK